MWNWKLWTEIFSSLVSFRLFMCASGVFEIKPNRSLRTFMISASLKFFLSLQTFSFLLWKFSFYAVVDVLFFFWNIYFFIQIIVEVYKFISTLSKDNFPSTASASLQSSRISGDLLSIIYIQKSTQKEKTRNYISSRNR